MGRPKLVPYSYQKLCLDILVEHFFGGALRALIVMASGLGKTLLAAFFLEIWFTAFNGRVIFILDQGDPLFQAHKELDRVLRRMGVTFGFWRGKATKFKNIEACNVLFTTFQAMRFHKERFGRDAFDIMVVDEAHHGQAKTYREVIEYFTAIRIGLTATPDREDDKDIEELFGAPVFELSLAKALAERLLAKVDYRVMHDNLNIALLREYVKRVLGGDRTISRRQLDDTIFLEERNEAIAQKVREVQAGKKKTIFFCRSKEHLGEVQKLFPQAKPYHSKVPKNERRETYQAFRSGKLREILVINMFNEAMDIPEAELLVFWRATDSKRIWLQQLGRGLRGSGKTVIVLDFVANCDRIMAIKELGLEVTKHTNNKPDDFEPFRINAGFSIEFTEELVEIVTLLERLEAEFYPIWEDASAAAQRLIPRPSSAQEYDKLYKQDPRLCSYPWIYYPVWRQNGGWPGFLGTLPYSTWEEASAAAQKLMPRPMTLEEYHERYKQDRRLTTHPWIIYAPSWKRNGGVKGFLGTLPYSTWEEASAAAQKLMPRPWTVREYQEIYGQNQWLPSSPYLTYSSVWKKNGGWPGFLGTKKSRK